MKTPNPYKLNIAKIQKALYDWIKSETDGVIPQDQIVWRNQSEPLPTRPCVSMKIISGPKRTGYQDNTVMASDTAIMIGGQREMTVSIQVFGNRMIHRPLSNQMALDLNSSLSKSSVLDRLSASGVAVCNQGEVTNLTALEETEYEERAGFDVLLSVAENITDETGFIEHADVTPDVSGP